MERRLKMMVAGSIAVWVPVASAAEIRPNVIDLDKAYRLKAATSPVVTTDVR
jgi:hypothetical protein